MSKKIEIIKKAYKIESFTLEMELELEKCLDDPVYFIENYMMVQHPKKGRVPLKLYDYQKRMIQAYHNNESVVALTGRQMGKCSTYNTLLNVNGEQKKLGSLIKVSVREKIVSFLENFLVQLSK